MDHQTLIARGSRSLCNAAEKDKPLEDTVMYSSLNFKMAAFTGVLVQFSGVEVPYKKH